MARELELRSALEEKGKKRGMTSGSHDLPDKYLGITSGGPSADLVRTVREAVVTTLPSLDFYYKLSMAKQINSRSLNIHTLPSISCSRAKRENMSSGFYTNHMTKLG